ncbi:hypothetical protein K504DRAFT_489966 [Pleomassaria siparia CBS 279.74]|uniref:MARVEL domain-containing protein n=1 Tax=Pleomassaria siparia CBS 279.74 TaxID=1314801 RepID=A0A6G1KDW0_9PLEO|nr:hypothetical protein K504DRAFT_489966 [Pleomassaria siparia CBS 279.74]
MAVNWILPVRALQTVLSIVVLGLMAYVSSWWTSHWRQLSPAEVNWLVFAPVWTLVALIALVALPWKMPQYTNSKVSSMALFALEALTMVHWLAGFIALAVFLSDRICFGTVCQVAKAGTVIAAFQWVTWTVTLVFAGVRVFGRGQNVAPMLKEPKVEMHQGV